MHVTSCTFRTTRGSGDDLRYSSRAAGSRFTCCPLQKARSTLPKMLVTSCTLYMLDVVKVLVCSFHISRSVLVAGSTRSIYHSFAGLMLHYRRWSSWAQSSPLSLTYCIVFHTVLLRWYCASTCCSRRDYMQCSTTFDVVMKFTFLDSERLRDLLEKLNADSVLLMGVVARKLQIFNLQVVVQLQSSSQWFCLLCVDYSTKNRQKIM